MSVDPELYVRYSDKFEEHKTITKELGVIKKLVKQAMMTILEKDGKGKNEVCISQQNSANVIKLKTSQRMMAYNTDFVHRMMEEFVASNGQITASNIDAFMAFADEERASKKISSMRLSCHKQKLKDKPSAQKLTPAIPHDDTDEFASQV